MACSENGWQPARIGHDDTQWVSIPGTTVNLQFMKGIPCVILRALAADYHAYIEPLRDPDSCAYTPTNSVATSNHLNGTAMDLNWNSHPFRVKGTFTGEQIRTIEELKKFYEGTFFWAGDWASPIDEMHWQMGYETFGHQDHVRDVIRRKIRPDGYSTFRRGALGEKPVGSGLTADKLRDVMASPRFGPIEGVDYAGLLPHVKDALRRSNCGSFNRIAMWLAQIGHESGGLQWMEEIADGSAYEGRCRDLGNCFPGDGKRYKGRGPIQVTGRANYTRLSTWAAQLGIVNEPDLFVEQPELLSERRYGFLGAVWYWTVARPNINAMCDAGDLIGVTKAINGGLNGLDDRRGRYDRILAMGADALRIDIDDEGEGFLSALTPDEQRQLYNEVMRRGPSRSFLADDGSDIETQLGFIWNIDGNAWNQQLTWAYLFDVPLAVQNVERVAAGGFPDDAWVSEPAQKWLQEFGQSYCQGLVRFKTQVREALAATIPARKAGK